MKRIIGLLLLLLLATPACADTGHAAKARNGDPTPDISAPHWYEDEILVLDYTGSDAGAQRVRESIAIWNAVMTQGRQFIYVRNEAKGCGKVSAQRGAVAVCDAPYAGDLVFGWADASVKGNRVVSALVHYYRLDVPSVGPHELGHALGLAHLDPCPSGGALMCVIASTDDTVRPADMDLLVRHGYAT